MQLSRLLLQALKRRQAFLRHLERVLKCERFGYWFLIHCGLGNRFGILSRAGGRKTRTFSGWFPVIGPTNGDRECGQGSGRRRIRIPSRQSNRIAQSGQSSQQARQFDHHGALAGRCFQRDRLMRLFGQDRTDEPRQHSPRPDFDERPHSRANHVANLLDEFDWLGDLLRENIADHLRIARIFASRRVRKDRQLSRVE